METRSFPYNPKSLRRGFMAGAGLSALLTGMAAAQLFDGQGDTQGFARAGLLLGLFAAFAVMAARTRPRPGWGVHLSGNALTVDRPLSRKPVVLPLDGLRRARREGKDGKLLVLYLESGGSLWISKTFYAQDQDFEALTRAVQTALPEAPLDA